MKLRIASDIHTEFMAREQHKIPRIALHTLPEMDGDSETTLILAGDIGSMHKPKCLIAFIDAVAPRFKDVFYIPGNHEYYGGTLKDTPAEISMMLSHHKNLWFAPLGVFQCGDENKRRIFYTTLWTNFDNENPVSMFEAQYAMNDYQHICNVIKNGITDRILPAHTLALHKKSMEMLEDIREGDIVITHHLPSRRSVPKEFIGSNLNGAYASMLDRFIAEKKPALWIHGHTHSPCDYMIGDTRIICNPRGYAGQEDNGYNPMLTVEL